MKVEKNDRGCFISHNGLTLFFNDDGSVKVTKRDDSAVYTQWHTVGEMTADKESIHKLGFLLSKL